MLLPPQSAFSEYVFCDLDRGIHDLENLISWWPDYIGHICVIFGSEPLSNVLSTLRLSLSAENQSLSIQ